MITSSDNPIIKQLKKLLTQKKERDNTLCFCVENTHTIQDICNNHANSVEQLVYSDEFPPEVPDAFSGKKTRVEHKLLQRISHMKHSCGAILIVKQPPHQTLKIFNRAAYLHEISNPSNLGAIIRNAAAFGLDALFLSPNSCDPYHPESVRAMAGSCLSIPILVQSLPDILEANPNTNSVLLDIHTDTVFDSKTLKAPLLVIFGPEKGLEESAITTDIKKMKIPLKPGVDSLNLAVSSGIVFYELRNLGIN